MNIGKGSDYRSSGVLDGHSQPFILNPKVLQVANSKEHKLDSLRGKVIERASGAETRGESRSPDWELPSTVFDEWNLQEHAGNVGPPEAYRFKQGRNSRELRPFHFWEQSLE